MYATVRRIVMENSGLPSTFKIGDVRRHPEHGRIRITGGYYLDPTYGRLSNFWHWVKLDHRNNPCKEGCGYGGEWPLVEEKKNV